MGWPGPLTWRQYLLWLAWLAREYSPAPDAPEPETFEETEAEFAERQRRHAENLRRAAEKRRQHAQRDRA